MAPVTGAQIIRFVFDQRATAQCFLARILWLQGCGSVTGLTKKIVKTAIAGDDGLSLCQTLVQGACPVALFVGDLEALEHYVTMLLDYSERQTLDFWQAFGRCFRGVLYIQRGHVAEGLARLGAALEELRKIQFGVHYGVFLSEFADALGRVGRAEEGLRAMTKRLREPSAMRSAGINRNCFASRARSCSGRGCPTRRKKPRNIRGIARLVPTPGDHCLATTRRDKPRAKL